MSLMTRLLPPVSFRARAGPRSRIPGRRRRSFARAATAEPAAVPPAVRRARPERRRRSRVAPWARASVRPSSSPPSFAPPSCAVWSPTTGRQRRRARADDLSGRRLGGGRLLAVVPRDRERADPRRRDDDRRRDGDARRAEPAAARAAPGAGSRRAEPADPPPRPRRRRPSRRRPRSLRPRRRFRPRPARAAPAASRSAARPRRRRAAAHVARQPGHSLRWSEAICQRSPSGSSTPNA